MLGIQKISQLLPQFIMWRVMNSGGVDPPFDLHHLQLAMWQVVAIIVGFIVSLAFSIIMLMWIIIFLLLLVQLNVCMYVCMYVCINVSNSQEHNPEYFLNKNSKQAKSLNSRESLDSQESKFLPTEQYLLVCFLSFVKWGFCVGIHNWKNMVTSFVTCFMTAKRQSIDDSSLPNFEDSPSRSEFNGSKSNSKFLVYDLKTIISATNNFSPANKLGKGVFGSVYKVVS